MSGDASMLADDLARCLDQADQVSESIKTSIDGFIAKQAIAAPEEARYRPVWTPPHERARARLSRGRHHVRSSGASAFAPTTAGSICRCSTAAANPSHVRGVTPVAGVYFLGLPWLYTWGSGRFSGVARDAEYLAEHIKARIGLAGSERPLAAVNEAAIGS